LLEELLFEFAGTLLVVSHDREFLDHVVTSTLVLEGKGTVGEYAGGYTDWTRQRAASQETRDALAASSPHRATKAHAPSAPPMRGAKKRKLTFKETNELSSLPGSIDALERERDAVYASLTDPAVLRDGGAVAAAKARLGAIESEIVQRLARWEEHETIAAE
jgi:ATP-binding cassette subfamily F protein uup